MKRPGMKNLVVILLCALANICVWQNQNPVGIAVFCAAYAMIPGKMLLAVATLSGMAYALPMTAFIKYAGVIITVMAVTAVIKKAFLQKDSEHFRTRLSPVMMYGLMVLAIFVSDLGYFLAVGSEWKAWLAQTAASVLLEFVVATGVYWVAVGMIALLNGWRLAFSWGNNDGNEEALIAKNQLHAFSESFRKLSESMGMEENPRNALNQQEMQDIFNAVTEQVCKDCSRCSYCWENVFEDSCETAYEILNLCAEKIEMEKKDLPERFRQRCVRSDNFLAEARRMIGLAQTNLAWQNRLAESRLAVAGQFGEVAEVIGNFSEQIGDEPARQGPPEKQILRRLAGRKIHVRRIAASKKPGGRQSVYIEARTQKNEELPVQEAADVIGRVYGRRYLPTPRTSAVISRRWQMLAFEEDVHFRTIIGDARMIRMGEVVSGDSYTVMHMDDGQVALSVSDGMGSGEAAQKESNRIISLLEQLLSTGFNRQSAVRLIHSVVLSGSEPHTYSTLDLGVVDLFGGSCEMVKMGAAPSFIKSGDKVQVISCDCLPPGVLREPEDHAQTVEMGHGDMLIMMSDGVLNSLGHTENEEKMKTFLETCNCVSPQEMANTILNHAMACSHYEAEDDMTVLVCGLYSKG